jgi:hypothetical protein
MAARLEAAVVLIDGVFRVDLFWSEEPISAQSEEPKRSL